MPELITYSSCTIRGVHDCLNEIRLRKDDQQRRVLNDSQYVVVEQIATVTCEEMEAVATSDFESLGEPLRWLEYAWWSWYRQDTRYY